MPTIEDIQSDFSLLDDWEDRYRYVIELGRKLPPLSPDAKSEANKVRGCASQVWLTRAPVSGDAAPMVFAGESDSHIVQGLIAILLALVNGHTPHEIIALDIQRSFDALGLKEHLTAQRANGLASMIARIRADAEAVAARQ